MTESCQVVGIVGDECLKMFAVGLLRELVYQAATIVDGFGE